LTLDFKNKVVIITGGTRGIGLSMVSLFSRANANIIVTGTSNVIHEQVGNLTKNNNIEYHQLDYSSDESIDIFINSLIKQGKVDVLINNAGVNKIDSITKII
jgi:Dehydrogenases with different specificities (related to short-chain alcohol dehydrogenases)